MAFTNTMFEFPQMIRGDASPDKVPNCPTIGRNLATRKVVLEMRDVEKEIDEKKEMKQARRTKAAKEETVGALRKAGKKLAATTISEPTISRRKKKAEAKKELRKKKSVKKKVEAAANQLEKDLGALAVGEEYEDDEMAE